MILNSVIIIFREALEAAIIISLMLAICNDIKIHVRWIVAAFFAGCGFSYTYASLLLPISNWFDGVGQEVVNASLQLGIVFLILMVVLLWLNRHAIQILKGAIIVAIVMALTREGAEIYLYISGYSGNEESFASVLLGGTIGFAIGISVGSLLYYGVSDFNRNNNQLLTIILLSLVSAGQSTQAINLLIQADWLEGSNIAWNSAALLPEDSISGQLFYAVLGYEATPTILQVIVYLFVLLAFAIAAVYFRRQLWHKNELTKHQALEL